MNFGGTKLKKVLMLIAVVAVSFAVCEFAYAQVLMNGLDVISETSGLPTGDLFISIANIIRILLGLLGIILVGLIVYAGFLWMTAGGDPKKVETAKKIITNAIIGLIIVMSAFGIAQFILSNLVSATQEGGGGGGGGGGGIGGGFGETNFILRGITPSGAVPIRNVVARATFNSEIDGATVAGNVSVTRVSDGTMVDGTFTTARNTVEFTPSANCPAPNEDRKCFDADTAYNIKVTTNLTDMSGRNLVCGGFAPSCDGNFTTGSLVDVSGPAVSITAPDNGESISIDSIIVLQAIATDDAGVSQVEFFVDDAFIGADAPSGATSLEFYGASEWNTEGITVGRHNITARAYDIDSNTANSSAISVNIRPAHCFNGVRDADEGGMDCGGGECGACDGSSCVENTDCTSGLCRGGVCVSSPRIEEVSPNNGMIGNYITISGEFFGADIGRVVFQGTVSSDDDREANVAPCSSAWQSNEVVVLVPEGAIDGPIQLCAANEECDTTNNERGFAIADFDVNETARPGICGINPRTGLSGDAITISGSQFGESQGGSSATLGGRDISPAFWGDIEIRGTVPNISQGRYPVSVTVGGEQSNTVYFMATSREAGTVPSILSITPASGPREEYVQISGMNFGGDVGRVIFRNTASGDEANGLTNFPAQCGSNFWHDSSITVKVPQQYLNSENTADGAYEVRIVRADGTESGSINFSIAAGTAGPGICRINPDNGPANTNVDIYGERFGSSSGQLKFTLNKNATIGSWSDRSISSFVPASAETGVVSAIIGASESNGVNFTVRDCNTSGCGEGEECCASGVCVAGGEECSGGPRAGGFAWRFSTGIIPTVPRVIEECREGASPSPSPWDKRSGGNNVCVNAAVNVRFSTNINLDTLNNENILVYQCTGVGTNPCETLTRVNGLISSYEDGFQFVPGGGNFVPASQYYVYLTTGIQGADEFGEYMLENSDRCGEGNSYCFGFATRGGDDPCEVGSVAVDPASFTIKQKNGTSVYNASALDQNDICIALNPNAYNWVWTATKEHGEDTLNTITNNDVIGGGADGAEPDGNIDARQIAVGVAETIPDPADHINAEIALERVTDFGQLVVDFTDPEIISKWPGCDTACVNSEIGAEFNTLMDEASLTREGNFIVMQCVNENCKRFGETLSGNVSYDTETSIALFNHTGLEQNTYYRAVIKGGISGVNSVSGTKLVKTNYGADNRDYSWVFKTRDSNEPCSIYNIGVSPETATLRYIGETRNYNATALGAPDDCNPKGQRLLATNYNWNWSSTVPTVADFFMGDGALLDILPRSKDIIGCSNVCLHTGTKSRIPVCGNRSNEKGEDCDDGNTTNGDGCSSRCLYEGSASTCGNGVKDAHENCDDGNTADGDGCSAVCLSEGASIGGSVCGNGDIGDGENCDDGNRNGGDGCSSDCLNEGTISGLLALCGNGTKESGEDCDDGNLTAGDGCSAICLREGTNQCEATGDLVCCGNGTRENGEDCDDGNSLNGDGCSARCLNEGSSIKYGSICGNGINESDLEAGEECEFPNPPSGDRKIDPSQYMSAKTGGETLVRAGAEGKEGEGVLNVACNCRSNADCSGAGMPANLACGSDKCCALRPEVIKTEPAQGNNDICRNALIRVTFDQKMDSGSLRNGIRVDSRSKTGVCADGIFANGWCEGAITGTASAIETETATELIFTPSKALPANVEVRVVVLGDAASADIGVKNKVGIKMAGSYSFIFATGGNVCLISKVEISSGPNTPPITFTQIIGKTVAARAISLSNGLPQEIFGISGLYNWSWNWENGDESLLQMSDTALENRKNIIPLVKKGKTRLGASVTITEDRVTSSSTVGKKYGTKADVIVMICVNPWPAREGIFWKPYIDTDTNFTIYYCRDAGEEGVAEDLPNITVVPTTAPISSIIKEYILRVSCGASTNCKIGDALGIRVAKNAEHYSPMAWFAKQGFRGSPAEVEVDGFKGVQDGRTVYINAFNNPEGTSSYFTNVYILSHTQNAGTDTQEIHNQIYENIGFGSNIQDLDLKDAITRDVKRLSDVRIMEGYLNAYASTHKKCSITTGISCAQSSDCPSGESCVSVYPSLESGSYMPKFTNSKWPSWQTGLGGELGKSLPLDPLNSLGNCGTIGEDCYDETGGIFTWLPDAYAYFYENCALNNYALMLNLEFPEAGWVMSPMYPAPAYRLKIIEKGWSGGKINNYCSLAAGTPGGTAARSLCGNGIAEGMEVCDEGTNNGTYNHCRIDCTGVGMRCGDGRVQAAPIGLEVCDEGALNGTYNHCSWDCNSIKGAYCGDGIKNGTEICDGDVETNNVGCALSGGYMTKKTRTCNVTCAGWSAWGACMPTGSCGNGIKDGTEQCDDGNTSDNDSCINSCKNAVCGDGLVREGFEQCDMGSLNGVRCAPGSGLTCAYCSSSCALLTISGE
jgi:cysteine-rich repeat protein